ncbi:hypothetical protein FHS83_003461 [Rhizomicrobium palustre]|uniref:Uncharacterized protein n=1 Tax=Rhizomicrobium palustre TaxID=189966 RepID=A0A846N3F6_9PROT|nr:hypothetical protein [Rhizomicrobium palustre]NIK90143.1 hypothetical protein [Rhizomicrobium palustre]
MRSRRNVAGWRYFLIDYCWCEIYPGTVTLEASALKAIAWGPRVLQSEISGSVIRPNMAKSEPMPLN